MPRNEKKPTTSVTVVTNGPDAIAGSTPSRIRPSGMKMPPSAAAASTQIMASPITTPRSVDLEPGGGDAAHDHGKAQPVDEADHELAAHHAPRIGVAQILGGERAHRHRHGLRSGIAAHAGDDRHQHGERHHVGDRGLELADHPGGQQRGSQIGEQPGKPALDDGPDRVRQLFVAADAAERRDVLGGLLLDHVDHVIDVDDADQALGLVHHRGGDQVVALEHARHLLLVGGGENAPPVRVHQFGDMNRALGAQQAVEPHRAEQLLGVVHHVKLEKPVRQVGGFAHVVDRVADRPVRRHRDELRLHAAAGGVLRIVQDLLDRAALGLRHLLEDLGLLILGQRLDDLRGIVGIEVADAFGDGLPTAIPRGSPRGPSPRPR